MLCVVLLSLWLLPALSCNILWTSQCALSPDRTSLATCILSVSTVRQVLDCASYDATHAVGLRLPKDSHLTGLDLISPDLSPYGGLVPGQGDDGLDRMLYVSPKGILMYAARSEKCRECYLANEFYYCPWDMPGFIDCLCYRQVRPEHIQCLEQCVPRTKLFSPAFWKCRMVFRERWPRLAGRDFNEMQDSETQIKRSAPVSYETGRPFTYDANYSRVYVTSHNPQSSTYIHELGTTTAPLATKTPASISTASTTITGELETGSTTVLPRARHTTASGGNSGTQSASAPSAAIFLSSHGIRRMVLLLGLFMLV